GPQAGGPVAKEHHLFVALGLHGGQGLHVPHRLLEPSSVPCQSGGRLRWPPRPRAAGPPGVGDPRTDPLLPGLGAGLCPAAQPKKDKRPLSPATATLVARARFPGVVNLHSPFRGAAQCASGGRPYLIILYSTSRRR